MAEESGLQSVKVRDLISAFESKTTTVPSRPRARSLGDVLSKNVVVREHHFNTLDDIEEALERFEAKLHDYEVYKKEKHVALQNEVFNILTSIVSAKSDSRDDEKKKYFIMNTQRFVSLLNTKLPSNNSTGPEGHKYVTYERFKKTQATAPIAVSDKKNEDEEILSVRNLRKNFEPTEADTNKPKLYRSEWSLALNNPDAVDSSAKEVKQVLPVVALEETKPTAVSVSKLKSLFEVNKKRSMEGLGAILSKVSKFKYRVQIPYNARREPVRTMQNSIGVRRILGRTTVEEVAADSDSDDSDDEVRFQEATVVSVRDLDARSWSTVQENRTEEPIKISENNTIDVDDSVTNIISVGDSDSGSWSKLEITNTSVGSLDNNIESMSNEESGAAESDSASTDSLDSVKAINNVK